MLTVFHSSTLFKVSEAIPQPHLTQRLTIVPHFFTCILFENCNLKRITKAVQYEEKEKFLSSIVTALDKSEAFQYTTVNARARILRGELYDVHANAMNDALPQKALEDANRSISILELLMKSNRQRIILLVRAMQLKADSLLKLNRSAEAIGVLREAIAFQSPLITKISLEIKRIQSEQK
jgi:hypothetical protein